MLNTLPKESLYNIGVKAAILNSNGQMLALHITRSNGTDTYWDLPGGRIVDGETPEQALRREVAEETGITEIAIDHHLSMAVSGVKLPIFNTKKVGVVFSVYVCHSDSIIQEPEERITMHWLPVREVAANFRANSDWPVEVIERIESL